MGVFFATGMRGAQSQGGEKGKQVVQMNHNPPFIVVGGEG
jgi:hypothetical protein